MKERGLTFCQELVPKVLDGSKFVTRRLGGLKEINENPDNWTSAGMNKFDQWIFWGKQAEDEVALIKCRQGVVGDRFYMQEAWGLLYPTYKPFNGDAELMRAWQAGVEESRDYHHSLAPLIPVYKADHITGNDGPGKVRWRSGRFQPKWACRPQRWELVSIRPERLQEITFTDCIAEGIDPIWTGGIGKSVEQLRGSFWRLWDSINAKRGFPWEKNPWVWRVEWNPKPVKESKSEK